jgi:hypothetical protein
MTPEEEFILAAARVARAAPDSWKLLLGAAQSISTQQINYCIQSPLEELPRAQGRAQYAARIYGLMADCLASADKIERNRK